MIPNFCYYEPSRMFSATSHFGIVNKRLRRDGAFYQENIMKKIITLWAVLILACFSQLGYSAGGPMNEDLTTLIPMAQKAVDAGKQGDKDTFIKEVSETISAAQTHPISASQQRVLTKMRKALKRGNSGKLDDGTKLVEEAMTNMGKKDGPSFGGGS